MLRSVGFASSEFKTQDHSRARSAAGVAGARRPAVPPPREPPPATASSPDLTPLTNSGLRATYGAMARVRIGRLALVACLGGCATWHDVDAKKLEARKAKELLVVLRAPPVFQAEGP